MSDERELVFAGTITERVHGENDDALFLDPAPDDGREVGEPLAQQIADELSGPDDLVTVSYWITDEPRTLDQLVENDARRRAGAISADYTQAYSEITGYLWTDEELNVGGHDLIEELRSNVGRWCCLRIRFDRPERREAQTRREQTNG